jgi:hypothetical protein
VDLFSAPLSLVLLDLQTAFIAAEKFSGSSSARGCTETAEFTVSSSSIATMSTQRRFLSDTISNRQVREIDLLNFRDGDYTGISIAIILVAWAAF